MFECSYVLSLGSVFSWVKFVVIYILEDPKGLSNWDKQVMIYQHLSHFLVLSISTSTCFVTLSCRLWACLSAAMINSHRALRCLQDVDAPYRTQIPFLMHNFLMSHWEMLSTNMLKSSKNQPLYWWQVPNSNCFWFAKCWSNIRNQYNIWEQYLSFKRLWVWENLWLHLPA